MASPELEAFQRREAAYGGNPAVSAIKSAASVGMSPDEAAEAIRTARFNGTTTDVAKTDIKAFKADMEADDAANQIARSRALSAWIVSGQARAEASRDDLVNLADLDETIKKREPRQSVLMRLLSPVAEGIDYVVRDYDPSISATRDYWAKAKDDITAENVARSVGAGVLDLGTAALGVSAALYDNMSLAGSIERIYRRVQGRPDGTAVGEFLTEAGGDTSRWIDETVAPQDLQTAEGRGVLSGVRSFPTTAVSLVPGIRAANAARAAQLTGSVSSVALAGAGTAGVITGGQSYIHGRTEGLDPSSALVYASIDAAVETGTEVLPLRKFFGGLNAGAPFTRRLAQTVAAESVGEQIATVMQDFNAWAFIDANKGKTFGDYLAERPSAAYETLWASLTMSGAMTVAQEGLERAANRFDRTYKGAFTSERDARTLELLQEVSAASKLAQRDSATFEEFVRSAAEGTEATDVFVDAEQLMQVMDQSGFTATQTAEMTGTPVETLLAQVEAGGDVRIPIEVYTARIANTEASGPLLDHLRIDPEAMSRKEAATFMQAAEQEFQTLAAEELDKSAVEDERVASRDRVRDAMLETLNAARRFTPGTNFAYATLHAHAMANIGAREGLSAEEMAARYQLDVQSGEIAQPTFDQPEALQTFRGEGGDNGEGRFFSLDREFARNFTRSGQDSEIRERAFAPSEVYTPAELPFAGDEAAVDAAVAEARAAGAVAVRLSEGEGQPDSIFVFDDSALRPPSSFNQEATHDFRAATTQNLEGLPESSPGVFEPARVAAIAYMDRAGLPYAPPGRYAKVDRQRAERIAAAYEAMKHDPLDPEVKAAYEALSAETLAQWQVVKEMGLVVEFAPAEDPYGGNPWGAVRDVRDNNHMYVFNTEDGYGQQGITPQDERENPMLAVVPGEEWSGRPVRVNDIFRAVHDYFGHVKDGVGFRAAGEENAWRSHAAMFSPLARKALTTETRGQNSWLNFGPQGETNRTAAVEDTVFAEQKIGLLPQWVVEEGRTDEPLTPAMAALTEQHLGEIAANLGVVEPERFDAIYRNTLTRDMRVGEGGRVYVLADHPSQLESYYHSDQRKAHNYAYTTQDSREWLTARPMYLTEPPVNPDGTITVQHYGSAGIETTDPNRWGESDLLPRSERNAIGDAPPRTYFGIATGVPGGYRNEFGASYRPSEGGRVLYEARIPADRLYARDANPDGIGKGAGLSANAYERAIRDAGYAGYWASTPELGLVAVVFDPVEVVEVPLGNTYSQDAVFYSALARAIGQSKTTRAPAQQWIATLKKTPGVKEEELEWSGILDFLEMQEEPVTREQLLALVQDGGIQIEEVLLGDPAAVNRGSPYAHPEVLRAMEGASDIGDAELQLANDGAAYRVLRREHPELFEDENGDGVEDWVEVVARSIFAGDPRLTRFGQWTTDRDNETYRELLITLPLGRGRNPDRHPEDAHFGNDAEGVVAHARFMEKTDTDGNKVLFVEEVQSDWHQKGRDEGYARELKGAEFDAAYTRQIEAQRAVDDAVRAYVDKAEDFLPRYFDAMRDLYEGDNLSDSASIAKSNFDRFKAQADTPGEITARYQNARNIVRQIGAALAFQDAENAIAQAIAERSEARDALDPSQGVPDAPFRTSWPALVMKRMIRWAVDNGYQKIAWTTGAQQAERYNLSQSVGTLSATLQDDGNYHVEVSNSRAVDVLIENNLASESDQSRGVTMTEAQLVEAFGKDVSARIVEQAAEGFDARRERQEYVLAAEDARDAARDAIEQYEQALRDQTIEALINDPAPGVGGVTPERLREISTRAVATLSNEGNMRALGWDAEQQAEWQAGLDALWNDLTNARREVANAESLLGYDVQLEGDDLTVGGAGMKAFYDRNLVNITNGLIKKYGGRVGPVEIAEFQTQVPDTEYRQTADSAAALLSRIRALDAEGGRARTEQRIAELRAMQPGAPGYMEQAAPMYARKAEDLESALPLWDELQPLVEKMEGMRREGRGHFRMEGAQPGFEITPELARVASAGFPLFQRTGQPRGQIAFGEDIAASPSTITLLRGADLSTFLHESGHFYWEVMTDIASRPGASDAVKRDVQTMLGFVNVASLEDWHRMTTAEKRPGHEQIARAFEAYLFEGRAPSPELNGLFGRFARWLRAVYRELTNLNVELTDEVRGVFDRMLASEQEIAEVQAQQGLEPFFADRPEGVAQADWEDYQRQNMEATEAAVQNLASRSLRDMQYAGRATAREIKKLQREASENRKAIREEVEAEFKAEPAYRAISMLRTGKLDGEPVDGDYKMYTPEVRLALQLEDGVPLPSSLNGMTSTANGVHPQQIADLFGYDSVDALMQALLFATPMREAVEAETDNRMRERYGELSSREDIEQAAQAAVHNTVRGRFVATELAALRAAQGNQIHRRALTAAARKMARDTISRLPLRAVRPGQYEAAEKREARKAIETRGDVARAAQHKRNQLLQFELAKEAHEARDEAEKIRRYLRKFSKQGTRQNIDKTFLDQIDQLLEAVQLKQISDREADRRKDIREWIADMEAQGFTPVFDAAFLDQISRKAWRDLTVDEIRQLNDSVRNVEYLGRRTKELLTAKDKADLDAAATSLADSIREHAIDTFEDNISSPSYRDKVQRGFFDLLAFHRKMGNIAYTMDGNRYGGQMWERFTRGANAAGDRETSMNAEATRALGRVFDRLRGQDLHTKKVVAGVGSMSLEARLAIALNLGNSTNRARVMDGRRWSQEQVDAVTATLDNSHWDFVEAVWEYLDSFWPEIAAKEERITGVAPQKVEAEPFQVEVGGELRLLRGGYYPIKYNPDASSVAEAHTADEILRQMQGGVYTRATTRRGHTKERVDTVKGRPLRHDFSPIFEHVSQVIHDLTHHEWLIDANRLIGHPAVDAAIREHYGPSIRKAIKDGITDIAVGDLPAQNVFESMLNYVRTGTTVASMGFSLWTSLLQPLGLTQSIGRIGVKHVARGIGDLLSNPAKVNEKLDWIYEVSPFMRERSRTIQREINEIRNRVGPRNPVRSYFAQKFPASSETADMVADSYFWLIAKAQLIADLPTWMGQYAKSMDAGEAQARAVAIADQAVIDSQTSGMVKDLAKAQRGGPYMKLFTAFYSYFSGTYNLISDRVQELRRNGPRDFPSFLADFSMFTFVPASLTTLMFEALRGSDDDDEPLAEKLAKENVAYLMGTMVGLRDIGSMLSGFDYKGPTGLRVFSEAQRFARQVSQGELDEPLYRSALSLSGILLHVPAAQIDKTVRGFIAWANGDAGPAAPLVGPPIEE